MSTLKESRSLFAEAMQRTDDPQVIKELQEVDNVLSALEARNEDIDSVSGDISELKDMVAKTPQLADLKHAKSALLSALQKHYGLIKPGHHQQTWMALGMAAFGIPLGVVFGVTLSNIAFFAIGLPIGLAIGLGVGSSMDKKAAAEGKVLQVTA